MKTCWMRLLDEIGWVIFNIGFVNQYLVLIGKIGKLAEDGLKSIGWIIDLPFGKSIELKVIEIYFYI